MLKTEIYDTEREMSLRCAQIVKETLDRKPDALLCFPAGMSVAGTCVALKEMQDAGEIDFSRAWFVSLDEWLDLEDESENCTNFLRKRLYGPLGIREEQMTLFDTHAEDLEAECRRIDRFIFDRGHIDLMLLGIGMSCTMVWADKFFALGIVVGVIGIAGVLAAYPVYNAVTKKQREKLAPEIMRLSDELMK